MNIGTEWASRESGLLVRSDRREAVAPPIEMLRPLKLSDLTLEDYAAYRKGKLGIDWRHDREPWVDRATGLPKISGGSTSIAYSVVSASAFSIATATKTAIMAISPAGHGLALVAADVSFDGVTSSAVPALVEVVFSTQAGAGTSGETPTITQIRGRATSGSAPTAGSKYSAEPTTLTRVKCWYVPQLMGLFVYQLPLGRELEIDSSGGTTKAIGIRITTSATVNVVCNLEVEAIG